MTLPVHIVTYQDITLDGLAVDYSRSPKDLDEVPNVSLSYVSRRPSQALSTTHRKSHSDPLDMKRRTPIAGYDGSVSDFGLDISDTGLFRDQELRIKLLTE